MQFNYSVNKKGCCICWPVNAKLELVCILDIIIWSMGLMYVWNIVLFLRKNMNNFIYGFHWAFGGKRFEFGLPSVYVRYRMRCVYADIIKTHVCGKKYVQ